MTIAGDGKRGVGLFMTFLLFEGFTGTWVRDDVSAVGRPGRWTMRAPYARYRRFPAALDK
jgi:hypothetical protein